MTLDLLLVAAFVLCSLQAIRAQRLLTAVLWLAGASAVIATTLYRIGAPEVAVIELSVGAGLVTVLFVFSIAVAGEDAIGDRAVVPPALAALLVVLTAIGLGWLLWPQAAADTAVAESAVREAPFAVVLWQERGLDMLVQIGLIFAGVLGILGLLAEPAAERVAEALPVQAVVLNAGKRSPVVSAEPPGRSAVPQPVLEEQAL